MRYICEMTTKFGSCDAQGMKTKENLRADQILLQNVEDYFKSGSPISDVKVRKTQLPPMYFQHAGR